MLPDATVYATIAVSDLATAKNFYSGVLDLIQVDENPGGITYESGNGKLFVYQSRTAGTNRATCAAWQVDNVRASVEELKSRGVSFEKYEIPGATMDGEIAVMGTQRAAWFKDPDGNILSVSN